MQECAIAIGDQRGQSLSGLAWGWPSLWTVGKGRLLGKGLDHRLSERQRGRALWGRGDKLESGLGEPQRDPSEPRRPRSQGKLEGLKRRAETLQSHGQKA